MVQCVEQRFGDLRAPSQGPVADGQRIGQAQIGLANAGPSAVTKSRYRQVGLAVSARKAWLYAGAYPLETQTGTRVWGTMERTTNTRIEKC